MRFPLWRMKSSAADSSVTAYLGKIGKIAILPKDQQLLHCKRIRKWLDWPDGKDNAPLSISRAGKHSINRMVESNLRMVVSVAKKYTNQGVPLEDLIQEGNIGLLTACHKFDPERGYCFTTFSYWWIRQGMTRCLANSSRMIRIPCNASELARKVKKAQDESQVRLGRLLSVEELALELDLPVEKIKLAFHTLSVQPRSLDELISDEGSTLWDVASVPQINCNTDLIENDKLELALSTLSELQRTAIELSIFYGYSKREIAEEIKVSSTEVGKLLRAALQALQYEMCSKEVQKSRKRDSSKGNHSKTAKDSKLSNFPQFENIVVPV